MAQHLAKTIKAKLHAAIHPGLICVIDHPGAERYIEAIGMGMNADLVVAGKLFLQLSGVMRQGPRSPAMAFRDLGIEAIVPGEVRQLPR
jgi:hypothetical protein